MRKFGKQLLVCGILIIIAEVFYLFWIYENTRNSSLYAVIRGYSLSDLLFGYYLPFDMREFHSIMMLILVLGHLFVFIGLICLFVGKQSMQEEQTPAFSRIGALPNASNELIGIWILHKVEIYTQKELQETITLKNDDRKVVQFHATGYFRYYTAYPQQYDEGNYSCNLKNGVLMLYQDGAMECIKIDLCDTTMVWRYSVNEQGETIVEHYKLSNPDDAEEAAFLKQNKNMPL